MSSEQRAFGATDYRQYVDAFNRSDFAGFGRYYAADVDFRGRAGEFRGPDAVLSFYRAVKARVEETLTVRDVITGPNQLVADVVTTLRALEDWAEFPTGPLRRARFGADAG